MAAGPPTAVDQEDKDDWSVRPQARREIVSRAQAIWPALAAAEPIAAYAGLRPAGRGINYLIEPSRPEYELDVLVFATGAHLASAVNIGTSVGPGRWISSMAPSWCWWWLTGGRA